MSEEKDLGEEKELNSEHYEMLYIVPNKYTEDEAVKIGETVKTWIAEKGGAVTYTENWGKKKLAYPIKSNSYGYYQLVEFDLAKDQLIHLEKIVRLSTEVLRHQVVKKRIKTETEIKEEKRIAEKIAAKNIEAKEKEEAREEKQVVEEKKKKKVDLVDLDEKLDKILDTGDLI